MRIFLVGLGEGFARSLARYVSGDPRVALIGMAPTPALAGMLLPVIAADVVLVDWAALNGAARDTVSRLRAGHRALRIVCVMDEVGPYRAVVAHAGADAAISRSEFAGELESLLHDYFPRRFGATGDRNA